MILQWSQVFGGSDLLLVHALEKVLVPQFLIRKEQPHCSFKDV